MDWIKAGLLTCCALGSLNASLAQAQEEEVRRAIPIEPFFQPNQSPTPPGATPTPTPVPTPVPTRRAIAVPTGKAVPFDSPTPVPTPVPQPTTSATPVSVSTQLVIDVKA